MYHGRDFGNGVRGEPLARRNVQAYNRQTGVAIRHQKPCPRNSGSAHVHLVRAALDETRTLVVAILHHCRCHLYGTNQKGASPRAVRDFSLCNLLYLLNFINVTACTNMPLSPAGHARR